MLLPPGALAAQVEVAERGGERDDWVSLEMEDLTMSVEAGVKTPIETLKATLSR